MMNRPRYSSNSRVLQQAAPRNPVAYTRGVGNRLSDNLSVDSRARQASIQEARRQMQMRYDIEAEEAAEKKRQKEKKKCEEWLARQEALVRPGHVLGHGNPVQKNLMRDIVTSQDGDEVQEQEDPMDKHYTALVQRRAERVRDEVQMERDYKRPEAELQAQKEIPRRPNLGTAQGAVQEGRGPVNQTAQFFLGTGYAATSASNDNYGHVEQSRPDHTRGTTNIATSTTSSIQGPLKQETVANTGNVLGTANIATSSSANDSQRDQRQEMLAARERLQARYNEQVQKAAETKQNEEDDADAMMMVL